MHAQDILLVDDDPGAIQVMNNLVSGMGRTRFATSGFDALRMARESEPDLVLLDAEMPGMSGFRVCEELRVDRTLKDVPVIFVTSHDDADFQLASFKLGATDYLTKPVNAELAQARIGAHLRAQQNLHELRDLLTIDLLTEVPNRRGFQQALGREWRRALRAGDPFSLLAVDIDQFAQLKTTRGETAADSVLKEVARCLTRQCHRPGDIVARVTAHCFAMILPMTARGGAEHVAHRVLDAIEALKLPNPDSAVTNHVTVSIGMGCYDHESLTWIDPSPDSRFANALRGHSRAEDVLHAAEIALRAAKLGGRAQAWLLDVADIDMPRLAREVSVSARAARRRARSSGTDSEASSAS